MDGHEFAHLRKALSKTQKEVANLLGTSLKAVHSYEQGWRTIPTHVERQLLFLYLRRRDASRKPGACWKIKQCPPEHRNQCPAWEFRAGTLCWFISGTICEGAVRKHWHQKIAMCRECEVLAPLLPRLDRRQTESRDADPRSGTRTLHEKRGEA